MRSIVSRIINYFRLPPVPVVVRDQDVIRETSRLRVEQNNLRARLNEKIDRVDDMFTRALASARGED